MSKQILAEMSNRYGADERYVLAGGGNTSFKEDGVLYVKDSGTTLATVKPENFVAMDLQKLIDMPGKIYPQDDDAREAGALADMMAARLPGEEQKRPSVEAILHAMFPQKYVLHVHPPLVNALSCSQGGGELCRSLFGEDVVWVPLTKPGYVLASTCKSLFDARARETGKPVHLAILQNHGIFAAADTVGEIDALIQRVDAILLKQVGESFDFTQVQTDAEACCQTVPALRMLYRQATQSQAAVAVYFSNKTLADFSQSAGQMQVFEKPFTPDHIVYCGAKPLFIPAGCDFKAAFAAFTRENGYAPKIIAVQGLGFFALGETKKEAEIARMLFLDATKIAVLARSFGGTCSLPDDFTRSILHWEMESYRQKIAPFDGAKRLDGKIAIVTGSAQGFGKGIAQSMAAQGAYLVIADLNRDGAQLCADELCAQYGENTAIAVACNVAEEDSVKAMVQACVLAFGGLDIMVANAGIAIAGSLTEMTKQKFELVTAVNYTGYFLCAKYASEPMKLQHEYDPAYLMDIIEINSKSGLSGSNKNFAYAGSKFGGVGLTQSFALELVEYGVKVNAICPGNLLDGPLWSDPEKGLFKQYFEAGKVPGAKSIADVRRFYESKVPMNRGCTTDDVACAIFYIVEQKYETGQAIPVTGGQIMLK